MASREKRDLIIKLQSKMLLTPQEFAFRWDLSASELAQICSVSQSTADHWLGGKSSRRVASKPHQKILGMTDFMLSNAPRITLLLERWLILIGRGEKP